MFRSFTTLLFFVAASVVGSYAQQASQTPACFTCPPQDTGNFDLGQKDESANPIFCSYPANPDEDPQDFFCTYSRVDGSLVTDNDVGFCPKQAGGSACATRRRRRDALPRSPRASEYIQDRSPKPEIMQTRSKLGALKRRQDA